MSEGAYEFTSRTETVEEYRDRTGSAAPPHPAVGLPRTYRLEAGFAEHDERLGTTASLEVRRQAPPTREEAVALLWQAIWTEIEQALGAGNWQPSIHWVNVVELLGE